MYHFYIDFLSNLCNDNNHRNNGADEKMVPQNNDGRRPEYTQDLGPIDPLDSPEMLFMDDVRAEINFGSGWRKPARYAEMAAG